MRTLQRLGTYLQRVVNNRWSFFSLVAGVGAGTVHRLLYPDSPAATSWLIVVVLLCLPFIAMLVQRVYKLESANEPELKLRCDNAEREYQLVATD